MANNEHSGENKFESVELTINQWEQVIEKALNSEKSGLLMFILRSWANQQSVSHASISAFRKSIIKNASDIRASNAAIGTISKLVRDVTGNPRATCYEWHSSKGEWTLGHYQSLSLIKALAKSKKSIGDT